MSLAGIAAFLGLLSYEQTGVNPAEIWDLGPRRLTTSYQQQEDIFDGSQNQIGNSGPGSTGTLARSGLGTDNWSNDTANTSNSSDPERALPNTGGGGGGDGDGDGQ